MAAGRIAAGRSVGREGAGKQRKGEENCAGSHENGKGLSMAGWRASSGKGTGPWLGEEGCLAASGYLHCCTLALGLSYERCMPACSSLSAAGPHGCHGRATPVALAGRKRRFAPCLHLRSPVHRTSPSLAEDNPDSWLALLSVAQSASVHTHSRGAHPSPVASPRFP